MSRAENKADNLIIATTIEYETYQRRMFIVGVIVAVTGALCLMRGLI